jgi:hypothetical protein
MEALMTTSNPGDRINPNWLVAAKAGNFSTMPLQFRWDCSAAFAHIVDGYEVAGGLEQCAAIAQSVLDSGLERDGPAASASDLWVALFFEHRRWRHFGAPPDQQDRLYLDRLCDVLREKLQNHNPEARQHLLAKMAAHPGMEVRRAPNP